ncbi:hypothetical protein P8452_08028 [Trifolium repens]|nr:hypothetical protein P8452_08028 [Trifolium repens]
MASSKIGSSIGNSGFASSVIRRRLRHCLCGEEVLLKIVGDILSVNYEKKFWDVEIGEEIVMQIVGSLNGTQHNRTLSSGSNC